MARGGGLTGKQKAAILMVSLGPEVSAQIFKHLREDEIEQLTLEIANLRKVESEDKETILNEFHQICVAQEYIAQGGIEYAKDILQRALGQNKAVEVINKLTASLQVRPFDFARRADPTQILNFIQNEHPQTISLILSYLESKQSAAILSALPHDKQADIAKRIATMDRTSPDIISEVERVLETKLSSTVTADYTSAGGIEAVVDILNGVDRGTERTILDALEIQDPELAEEIKKRMFVFEDIVTLDDRSIQRVIREVENADLILALKVASEEVRDALFRNMSKRMADNFKEEMEFMGPVRLRDVEESQTRIVAIIRKLEEEGEIIIARGGGDEIIV
ncbi:flagellar motor switch protein FliG [Desulfuribacillus stibiiarsenatis]|uniref:Flagellar motor switch protein FliG n=1 Tax=Desulfuribacillus stibiiarsenatis TaxID=1390249 RepID=A0A1E5L755_9FIRM|nr:flagellar motor switch protein FliG [Desulfuribacillus stibiiarsenatis]OEH85819.1 flagellar motor switch protein FliG [Desulfuribacillus stibiiarsenatis]